MKQEVALSEIGVIHTLNRLHGNRNVVRAINPPGQIWVIADLRADIKVDGDGAHESSAADRSVTALLGDGEGARTFD